MIVSYQIEWYNKPIRRWEYYGLQNGTQRHQQFIALVKTFPNEISNDDNDHSIPDFWTEYSEKNLIEPMRLLRAEGKRDLYGLCRPAGDSETHFHYGIGILIDDDTDITKLEQFTNNGYSIWETWIKCMYVNWIKRRQQDGADHPVPVYPSTYFLMTDALYVHL